MDFTSILHLLQIFKDYGGHYGLLALAVLLIWKYRPAICRLFRRFVRKWLGIDNRRPVKDVDINYTTIDVVIIQSLDALLARSGACRAWVFEFSGFDDRIRPLPFVTQSCTYERIAPGRDIRHERDNLQNMPLFIYPEWTRRLAQDLEISLDSIDKIKDADLELWKSLAAQKIQGLYGILLLDYRGVPVGVVGVDYSNGVTQTLKRKEDRNKFFLEAVKIAGLLAYKRNGSLVKLAGYL